LAKGSAVRRERTVRGSDLRPLDVDLDGVDPIGTFVLQQLKQGLRLNTLSIWLWCDTCQSSARATTVFPEALDNKLSWFVAQRRADCTYRHTGFD
jgi:hypothetical protein